MRAQIVDFPTGHAQQADVGTPQVTNLVHSSYHFRMVSDMVAKGRAKSAFNSEQVPGTHKGSEAPLEGWSRGCRRAYVSFWFLQWSRLSPLAPRSQNRHQIRSPLIRSTPASTSNLAERACLPRQGGPAPTPDLRRYGALACRNSHKNLGSSRLAVWAMTLLSPMPPADCHNRRQVRC